MFKFTYFKAKPCLALTSWPDSDCDHGVLRVCTAVVCSCIGQPSTGDNHIRGLLLDIIREGAGSLHLDIGIRDSQRSTVEEPFNRDLKTIIRNGLFQVHKYMTLQEIKEREMDREREREGDEYKSTSKSLI